MKQHTKTLTRLAEEIEERLDEHVDAVLSSRRTAAEPARRLAELGHEQRDFVLQWVAVIAKSNAEMAYQFAAHAGEALLHMDCEGVEAWAIQAMDAYDRKGLSAGIAQLKRIREFVAQCRNRASGLALEEVSRVLEIYIHGLNGRTLNLDAGDDTYTDTESLFLPDLINRFATRAENFSLYKAMAVHQWAQTWYGTWRLDLAQLTENLPQRKKAIRLFHALETLRLDACIGRELPGIYREMRALRRRLDPQRPPLGWTSIRERLHAESATAHDSWALVAKVMNQPAPSPCCYQGRLLPAQVREVIKARGERGKGLAYRPGKAERRAWLR